MTSPTATMVLDVLAAKPNEDIFKAVPKLKDIKCFMDYRKNPDPDVPVNELIKYVALLYSKDSILNQKPMEDLPNRMLKAAKLSGLDPENEKVISNVFQLQQTCTTITIKAVEEGEEDSEEHVYEDRISDLVSGFLIYQGNYAWSDFCATAIQMDENIRIRLKPIESNRGDKEIIEASTKKKLLKEHFSEYREDIKKLELELFADHENVKEIVRRKRTTLESMV